jgi:CHAD domain-containing protein
MTRGRPNILCVVLRQRVSRLVRALPAAARGDVTAVHDARVATRRLREVVPVLAKGKRARALLREARKLTRALGPVRELDVVLMTLAEMGERADLSDASIDVVRRAVQEERQRWRPALGVRLIRTTVAARAASLLRELQEQGTSRVIAARIVEADARRGRRARRLREAIEEAAGLYLPDRLHAVRIAVKKLRYSAEIMHDLRGLRRTGEQAVVAMSRASAGRIRTLRRAQEQLGRLRDLEVLAMRVRAVQGTAHVSGLQTSAELDRMVRRIETDCRTLHSGYVSSRPALLEVCANAEASWHRRVAARRSA